MTPGSPRHHETDIQFHTNLDEAKPYVGHMPKWGHVPMVGDHVMFTVEREERRHFTLRVCDVTWAASGDRVVVELHLPSYWQGSIAHWIEHMRKLEGRLT